VRGQSDPDDEEPNLFWTPYADGTSGHQGATSKAAEPGRRARIEDALIAVARSGRRGLTWKEYAESHGLHHGQASGALSNLHRSGSIFRLKESRGGSGVYVTEDSIFGRDTIPYRSNKQASAAQVRSSIAERLTEYREQIEIPDAMHNSECWTIHPRCALKLAINIALDKGEK